MHVRKEREALMEGGNGIGSEGANRHSYTFGMNQRKYYATKRSRCKRQ